MSRLSSPTLTINISLMGEKARPVAGPTWVSRKLCSMRRVLASHSVIAPSSEAVLNMDFLNAEYSSCRIAWKCGMVWHYSEEFWHGINSSVLNHLTQNCYWKHVEVKILYPHDNNITKKRCRSISCVNHIDQKDNTKFDNSCMATMTAKWKDCITNTNKQKYNTIKKLPMCLKIKRSLLFVLCRLIGIEGGMLVFCFSSITSMYSVNLMFP